MGGGGEGEKEGGGVVVVVVIESGVTECELKAIVSTAINNILFSSCKTSFWGSRCAGPIKRFTIKFPFFVATDVWGALYKLPFLWQ